MAQRSTDVGREQAVCCSFVLSVVPASSSTLSLANPAVENHSTMSIHQELLPDEASLADGSWMLILTLAGNPPWEWQTPLVTTTLSPHGHHTGTASLAVPATSPTHFTNTERSYSEGGSTNRGEPVLRGSVSAPAPPSYGPVGSFSCSMGGKQNSHILLLKGARVCGSTKIVRVGKKGVSSPKYGLTACKS